MTLNEAVKEKIAIEVIKTLVTRFDNFPEDASRNRNAPFHQAFLEAFADKFEGKVPDTPFFISLSSWLHGLNTTLGQVFFEKIAHHISDGEKREYTSKRLGNLPITQTQRNNIVQILADLSTSASQPNLKNENQLLFVEDNTTNIHAMDFSADVFFEDDQKIVAIELKSVKPNSGEMKGEKQKILEGKAALFKRFSNKEIRFYIAFPFDPTVDPHHEPATGSNKSRFLGSIINMNKYFAPQETLVANELWDFLSGQENTMDQIIHIINRIATPDFLNKFRILTENSNRNKPEYPKILNDWFLYSERELILNDSKIRRSIVYNKALIKTYYKTAFDSKGNYMIDRYNKLRQLI